MRVLRNVTSGFGTIRELMSFLRARRLWWLMPFVITLLFVGILVLVGQATGIGPFIYTLF